MLLLRPDGKLWTSPAKRNTDSTLHSPSCSDKRAVEGATGSGNVGKMLPSFPPMQDNWGLVMVSCGVCEYMFSILGNNVVLHTSPYSFPDTTHCGHYNNYSAGELLVIMHSWNLSEPFFSPLQSVGGKHIIRVVLPMHFDNFFKGIRIMFSCIIM